MQQDTSPIGVFDSGVGGLTVLREIRRLLPANPLIYFGDTARVPYGTKSPLTVRRYARQCTQFLLDQSVSLIIVACNTASALALDAIKDLATVPVIDVIDPAVRAALRSSSNRHIGVLGTRATIASGAYQQALRAAQPAPDVTAEACGLFVSLAEEGWHDHPATLMVAQEYLGRLKREEVDTVILGCTHFPLLTAVIQKVLPAATLINSGREAALAAADLLDGGSKDRHYPSAVEAPIVCNVSDKPQTFAAIAARFLGYPLHDITTIELDEHYS